MDTDLSRIFAMLEKIQQTQEKILQQTTLIAQQSNKPRKIKIKHRTLVPKATINIHDISSCKPALKHVGVVFFSSLEFTFVIVLIETLCDRIGISSTAATASIYDEAAICDNHYNIDVNSQLANLCRWWEEYKQVLPFKKTVDTDKTRQHTLLGYYNNQWCSTSYKAKLTRLYELFCIKIIKQFGEWQNLHTDDIKRGKLPNHLDYGECVLKMMGDPDVSKNTSKSIDKICRYLLQIC